MALAKGKQADHVRGALADLSSRFLRVKPARMRQAHLADGLAGLALAHAGLESVFPGAGHLERAERALDLAVGRLQDQTFAPSLHEGFVGIAWAVERLKWGVAEAGDDPCAPIDAMLASYLAAAPRSTPYDLMAGLVGIGVYAIDRVPRPSACALVAAVVDRLAETARRDPPLRNTRRAARPAIAWRSDPAWVPEPFRATGHADWNLGVAHGIPGIVAFLGLVCGARCDARTRRKARALLEGSVAWLLASELPASSPSCFSWAATTGPATQPVRSAWCYGDPGIALALLVAARGAGERAWEREAIRVGLRAAARPPNDVGIKDAGLCHGAAGLAHMFHRLYRASGEERFARSARSWLTRTLTRSRTEGSRAFAGFTAYNLMPNGKLGWYAAPGLLTGAAGIALALIATLAEDEPGWDRLFLMS